MRLKNDQAEFIKASVLRYRPEADVYLFGSRACDDLKGGDIDILVIGDEAMTDRQKRELKIAFYRKFGPQKVDLVSFRKDDPSPFKQLTLMEALKL